MDDVFGGGEEEEKEGGRVKSLEAELAQFQHFAWQMTLMIFYEIHMARICYSLCQTESVVCCSSKNRRE